ncbi:MAG: ABC transporter ATP-binding protein [Tenericutes bacterium HGW-Tenericutes-1]|jgi:ATP-binding cassette subfamily B protein|nr:MAG: ABC transporter ATP-binding protein [Tenericutes bacterium HGW-Tenericutes-1]
MKNIYVKIKWFIKEEWKLYVFMFFLLVSISLISLLPARVLGGAIDTIISGGITNTSLATLVGALILLPLTRYLLSMVYNYLMNVEGQKLAYKLRKNYLDHLFKMDSKFYETYKKGDLISRVTNDLDAITTAATSLLEGIVFNFGVIIIAILIMGTTISWELTLVSVTIMPIGLTILNKIRYNKRKYTKIHREIYADMTEKVLESVEGMKVIRAYVQEENDLKKQYEAIDKDIESWRYIVNYENWFNPLFEIIYGLSYFLAFAYGTYLIINQAITVGELITFVSYIGMLLSPIISVSTIFSQINNATISVDRYDEILQAIPEVHDESDSLPIIKFNQIDFINVTFKYPFDKMPVIKNIDFSIINGQTIGIVGPTGAGKSTLIRQLLREFNTTSGEIFIDNVPIHDYKINDVRNLVGYVPQEHMLFKKAVDENILVGNPRARLEDLDKAVKIADFEKDIMYLTDGLHTMVGEAGTTLSGGQKQRLSIARALIKDPQILILDDSLSAVDAKTEENIIGHLKESRSGKTNIIIAHRFSAIQDADQILVLEKGVITQRGTHTELLKQEGWYKQQYIQQITMK